MKRILLLSIVIFLGLELVSQCRPMSEQDYQFAKRRISMNQGGFNTFQSAMDIARANCLTSNQAKDIASQLNNDRDRIDFLNQAFQNISDPNNFTDVMDVFRLMSSAFRLYHMTLGQVQNSNWNPSPGSNPNIQNPNCRTAMNTQTYQQLLMQVRQSNNDRQMASIILNASQSQCLSTQQASGVISGIRDENIRLDVLKRLYPYIIDPTNYDRAGDGLSPSARQQFLLFLQNPMGSQNPSISGVGVCGMSDPDLDQFIQSVNNQSFDKDKVVHIKTHLAGRCLTAQQIKKLAKLSNFDESRLAIAQFLYDGCIDKQNFFVVNEVFSFSDSSTKLNEYIRKR